jgi:hypothetical protein
MTDTAQAAVDMAYAVHGDDADYTARRRTPPRASR